MRTLLALLFAILAAAAVPAGQEPQTPPAAAPDVPPNPNAPGAPPRRRIVAVLSDSLRHSDLVPCSAGRLPAGAASRNLRVATWNIHAGRSVPIEDIAAELKAMDADVIGLQEVDVLARRSGFVDQPVALAAALGYQYAFAASIKWDEGDYGLAVLSKWPLAEVRRHRLAGTEVGEPRIVLEVVACVGGRPLRIFDHHADGRDAAREAGFAGLRDILKPIRGSGLLVMGDFNETADGADVRGLVDDGLVDLGAAITANTTTGGRIDYVFADAPMAKVRTPARIWSTDKSDHQAVLADLEW